MPRVLALFAALLLAACNNENVNVKGGVGFDRFQLALRGSEVLLLDGATGDLWQLEQEGGVTVWQRLAERPADVRVVGIDDLLRPPTPTPAP